MASVDGMGGVFLSHPSSLEHDPGPHPEQPARIVAIERALAARDWLGYSRVSSPVASRDQLLRVHTAAHIDFIEGLAARGGGQIDLDTAMSAGSYEAALHSAGGARYLVELLVSGQVSHGFSAHRPPGHHAPGAQAMGFCLFNNIAVATAHALAELGLDRVLILDWDVHHGNGTQDIFYAEDRVLFVSIHQSPLYPGTGAPSEAGTGSGAGFTVNLPVPSGSGDDVFRSLVDHLVVPLARAFSPQLVLVSAGYDAHADDPLASCEVTTAGYGELARSVRDLADSLGVPVGCTLEGGYSLPALAESVVATLEALSAGSAAGEVPVSPLSAAALERVRRHWPQL